MIRLSAFGFVTSRTIIFGEPAKQRWAMHRHQRSYRFSQVFDKPTAPSPGGGGALLWASASIAQSASAFSWDSFPERNFRGISEPSLPAAFGAIPTAATTGAPRFQRINLDGSPLF